MDEIAPDIRTTPLPVYMLDYDTKIVAHEQWGAFGVEQVDYEWVGEGTVASLHRDILRFPARMDDRKVKIGHVVTLNALRLRVIDVDYPYWPHIFYVMPDGWKSRWQAVRRKLSRPLDLVYRRCIWTLAIWGLATVNERYEPTWRDIHLVRWLRKQLRKDS